VRTTIGRMNTSLLALVLLSFVLAGAVKGLSGMGLPALSMALLGLWMPPAEAAALMVWPAVLTNIVQCTGPHWRALLRQLWPLWAGMVLLTVATPLPDLREAGSTARVGLGLVLLAYGLWGWFKPALPDLRPHARLAGGAVGGVTGIVAAATGVFSMPLAPFLQTLKLEREAMVQALGISFMLATLALMVRLRDTIDWSAPADAGLVVGAVLATFVGVGLGWRYRRRLAVAQFQRVLFAVFAGLGVLMLVRAAWG
jgi:uncharacterized protein